MNDIHDDVIAAFADGEPVDPARLTAALSEAQGREHLIDLLVLRGLVGGAEAKPEPKKTSEVFLRFPKKDLRGLFGAAALVTIGVIGGFVAGHQLAGTRTQPPATTAANVAPQIVPASAPTPTRVIRLENGVDWNERGGGN
jgi:hypothetical protein